MLRVLLQNLKLLIVVENKVNVTINHLINVLGGCDKVKKERDGRLLGPTLCSCHFNSRSQTNELIHRTSLKVK